MFCFAVDSTEQHVVTGHRSLLLRHWSLATGEELAAWKAHDQLVTSMDFSSDSKYVASGSIDKSVKVWDVRGHFCTHNFRGHQNIVSHVKFHPSKLVVVAVSEDFVIKLWDLRSSSQMAVLTDHLATIASISIFASDIGTVLVTGSRDQICNVWSVDQQKKLKSIPAFESVEGVACFSTKVLAAAAKSSSKDCKWLTGKDCPSFVVGTVGSKSQFRLWSPSGTCLATRPSPHAVKGSFRRLLAITDGTQAMTIGEDLSFVVWSMPDMEPVRHLMGCNDEVLKVMWLPPPPSEEEVEPTKLVAVCNDEVARVIDTSTWSATFLKGHTDVVLTCDLSKNGHWMVTGSKDNLAKIWNLESNKVAATLSGHNGAVTAVAFPKKRKDLGWVLTGSGDRTIKMWTLPNLEGVSEPVEVKESKFARAAHEKDVNCVVVAPNDKLFATGGQDKVVKIWRLADCDLVGTCVGHRRGVMWVAFSPVEQVLASASGDKTVKLWNLKDHSCLKTFQGHEQSVSCVSFLSNGMQLLSAGSDGLVKLWNIRNTDCIATYEDHEDRIWSFDMRGEHMCSAGSDGKIICWKDVSVEVGEQRAVEVAEEQAKDTRIDQLQRSGDTVGAVNLALELRRPALMKKILEDYVMKSLEKAMSSEEPGAHHALLQRWVAGLSDEKLAILMEFIAKWMANAKNSSVATQLLHMVLQAHDGGRITKLEGINHLLTSSSEYMKRHVARVSGLQQKSYILDFVLQLGGMVALPEIQTDALSTTMKALYEDDSDVEDAMDEVVEPQCFRMSVDDSEPSSGEDEEPVAQSPRLVGKKAKKAQNGTKKKVRKSGP